MIVVWLCSGSNAPAQAPAAIEAVVDRDMSIAAGTADIAAVQWAAAAVEDRYVPIGLPGESSLLKTLASTGYRFGKWFGLDLPQDHFLMVVAHEVFGHGSRLREIGAPHISYSFDVPIPYGPGGAVTSFGGDVPATRADVLAVDAGGIEAQNVLADHLARRALARRALGYREAWLYFESRVDGLRYIRSVSPHSGEGHDVASFLNDANDGCDPPACDPFTIAGLKRHAWWMLADPLLAYSMFDFAVSYMVEGRTSGPLPMIPVGRGIEYLPAVRFALTSYGTEWTVENDVLRGRRLVRLNVRVGETGGPNAWGIGLAAADALHAARVSAGFAVDFWRQPPLDAPPASLTLDNGASGVVTANVPLGRDTSSLLGVLLQGGYKSDGFVPGERLHRGVIFRVGLTVQPD